MFGFGFCNIGINCSQTRFSLSDLRQQRSVIWLSNYCSILLMLKFMRKSKYDKETAWYSFRLI